MVRGWHLKVVQWLHASWSEGCTTSAMDDAAMRGYLANVQWLYANRREGCTGAAMDRAASRDHLHVVEWLHENRTEGCSTKAMDTTNSIQVLRFLHTKRTEGCTQLAMENAGAHFEILQWLRANYLEYTGVTESSTLYPEVWSLYLQFRSGVPKVSQATDSSDDSTVSMTTSTKFVFDNRSSRSAVNASQMTSVQTTP